MSVLIAIAAFIVALGVLIVVHEYGHYLVARLCNVKVLRFSVGFGRPLALWRRGRDRTEWVIAAIPFGGYVKMLDEREGAVAPAEAHRAFNRQSVWRRLAIVIAGPMFNLAFAVLVYAGLFMYGLPEARPVLGEPPPDSAAAAAGLHSEDTVRAVAGVPIATWQELRWRVLQAALQRESLRLEVQTARGNLAEATLDLRGYPTDDVETDALERVGLRLYRPPLDPVIGQVVAGDPAERAGLKAGDRVVRAGDKRIDSWDALVAEIRAHPGTPLALLIERSGATSAVEVVPESVASGATRVGRIGAGPYIPPAHAERMLITVRHGVLGSIGKALAKTWDISIFSLKMLGRMLTGQLSWKHLSGPVTIADFAGQSAQMGLSYYLGFLAIISISLGVLNLLPIPLLDGGHLMYYAIEIIKGSPVSERAMELGQRVGLALLLVMMVFAFYNDLNRQLTRLLTG
ncbi:MAG TPA: RIP metalloprotease RseP [Burkholderiales bacterium]|jgi:regulator of sigma E protease|nr:RIP metalloprotease RseP [Burkholderiales bacterium]